MSFVVGQRWISHTEARLGLGIIAEISGRLVTVSYPATGEERTYARDNAPLSRVVYKVGETVATMNDQTLEVQAIRDYEGLLVYLGSDPDGVAYQISELELDCFVKFTKPQQRLFSGQYDKNSLFRLRIETLYQMDRLQRSPVRGLLGSRTSLLPHQVYIASEVARRYAPRVLLADEVGLGKTIEAGMILHQQLYTGLANRVLIVVPPTLIHQWLVEMLRRFNLHFAIFDQERVDALQEEGQENPFESEQLVLCSLDLLVENTDARAFAEQAGWDLLVVDEAHHLEWSPQQASPQYQAVEQLALNSAGVLLLTATPEQVGVASHFARLRLLDPSRFHSLDDFQQEESGYREINQLVQALQALGDDATAADLEPFRPYLGAELDRYQTVAPKLAVDSVIARLLDRFGTGRVLFRNTRSAIPEFPNRCLHLYPLPCPALYAEAGSHVGVAGLYPEINIPEKRWIADDPRVRWLETTLKQLRPGKVLVICAHASTAMALERYLHLRAGIRSAAFYEGMSIVERDSAAAYFADTETGAQVLVCSEIGSEGRNFQFAHNLVLFDLPLNPDLLEQRIGRLDRIGQRHDIDIHVPYLADTAQQILVRWLNEGMNLFQTSFSAGKAVLDQFEEELQNQMQTPAPNLDGLIAETKHFADALREQMEQGRDPLLELNSCNHAVAAALIGEIEIAESREEIEAYLQQLCDNLGLEQDYHSDKAAVLRAGEHLVAEAFPGFVEQLEEGVTLTSSRDLALVREDMLFLSWEHPFLETAMEYLLTSEQGNAAVASLKLRGVAPGTLLVEIFYAVHSMAPPALQLGRYLPLNPVRLLLDSQGKDLSGVLSHQQLNSRCQSLSRPVAQAVIKQVREPVEHLLDSIRPQLQTQLEALQKQAQEKMEMSLKAELERLIALQRVNPAIRPEEISFLENQIRDCGEYIAKAGLEAHALRLVVTVG